MKATDELCGRVVGEYVLRERIGTGGFGAVYRGDQPQLGREVVVKVLHQRVHSADPGLLRLLDEARLAAKVSHPSAVHVYDLGWEPEGGLLWIAMEHVDGVPLSRWLRMHGPMPLEQLVLFIERVAEAIQTAHERSIVHRDVKPANMMVVERAGRLLPKLLDFGVAKLLGVLADSLEAPRPDLEAPGSPAYIAPEQWRGDAPGPGSDLYALAVVAYEALTGRRPFGARDVAEVAELHLHGDVPAVGPGHPPALDRFFRRAMAKRPEDRWATALELAAALRAASGLSSRAPRAPKAAPDAARDQLWTAARSWQERARPPGLLWRGRALAEAERLAGVSDVEAAFLRAGRTARRRSSWLRRAAAAIAASAILAGLQYRAMTRAELATEHAREAEAALTVSETEQGRAALLHGDPDAAQHLAEAQRRGADVTWMLARAEQPRRALIARLPGAGGRMWSAAWSPDGKRIATTDDGSARIWDAAGKLLLSIPHRDVVYQALWIAGGEELVTAAGDGSVRVWDAATGQLVRELRHGTAPVRYYALAVSGDRIAAIDTLGAIAVVWSAATGAELAALPGAGSGFPAIAFSADGRWLAVTGGADVRMVATADWSTATTIAAPRVRAIAWDPTGPRLAVGTAGGDAAIIDALSGARERHLREVGDPVSAIAWSGDGKLLATGAEIWTTAGVLQARLRGGLAVAEFAPSTSFAIATGGTGGAHVVDATSGLPIAALGFDVRATHFSPDAQRLVGVADGAARIWDATPPYRRFASAPIAEDCGVAMSLEPDRRFVAIACRDRGTQIWDTAEDRLVAELPGATGEALPAVSIAGDLAAIARGRAVELYELPGGRLLRSVAHGAAVTAVAFAPVGRALVSGDVGGVVLITRDGQPDVALPGAASAIDAVALTAGGRVIAAAGSRLRVYGADPTSVLADLEVPARERLLRPTLDGRYLVAVAALDGRPVAPVLIDLVERRVVAHLGPAGVRVLAARWVDGGRIVTAGNDGAARLWTAAGALEQVYRSPSRMLGDATIVGGMLVAGDADGQLRFWEVGSGRPLWSMPAHTSYMVGLHADGGDVVTRGFGGDVARWAIPTTVTPQ